MKNVRLSTLLALLCASGMPACSGGNDDVNIGNTQAIGSQLSDYAASWDGYAEAYTFSDGSDRVRLTIDASGNGTLQVGDSAPIPPATDENVGYPSQLDAAGTVPIAISLFPGFSYPLHAAQVQTDRIQLGVVPNDLWSIWCALQTPVPITGSNDAAYGCVDNLSSYSLANNGGCGQTEPDGTDVPIDCGKLALCEQAMVCTCTATGCTSVTVPDGTTVTDYPSEIDGALDSTGSTLTATMTLPTAPRLTVVLQKN